MWLSCRGYEVSVAGTVSGHISNNSAYLISNWISAASPKEQGELSWTDIKEDHHPHQTQPVPLGCHGQQVREALS